MKKKKNRIYIYIVAFILLSILRIDFNLLPRIDSIPIAITRIGNALIMVASIGYLLERFLVNVYYKDANNKEIKDWLAYLVFAVFAANCIVLYFTKWENMNKELVNNIVERIIMGILLLWSVAGAIALLLSTAGAWWELCLLFNSFYSWKI